MKPWYQSRIHWTNIIGTILNVLPFVLAYLDALSLSAETKALWVLIISVTQASLTSIFRNSTTTAIGARQDDNSDQGA